MLMENVPSGSLSQSCFAQVLQLLPMCTCVSGCSWSLSPCWCFMDSSLISTWDKAGAGEARTSGGAQLTKAMTHPVSQLRGTANPAQVPCPHSGE